MTQFVPKAKGDRIDPFFGKVRRQNGREDVVRTEKMLESARLRYAPHMPSRLDSVFATERHSAEMWRGQLSRGDRTLVKVRPSHPERAVVVDGAHGERVYSSIVQAYWGNGMRDPAEKRKLLAQARAAAKDYWTKAPTSSVHSQPEWLLGGGAVYTGNASQAHSKKDATAAQ
jgi:hypothetical protein